MLWHSLIIAHVYRISNKQTINVKKKFEVVFKEEALPHRKQIVSEGINCIKFQRVTWSYMHTESSFELIIIYYTILALSIEWHISNVLAPFNGICHLIPRVWDKLFCILTENKRNKRKLYSNLKLNKKKYKKVITASKFLCKETFQNIFPSINVIPFTLNSMVLSKLTHWQMSLSKKAVVRVK